MKKLISLLLALTLLLSFAARAEQAGRESLYADPSVVAVYNGGCVVYEDIRENLEMYISVYRDYLDLDITQSADDLLELQLALINECIESALVDAYVAREQLTLISPEMEASVLAEADAAYDSLLQDDPDGVDFTREELRESFLEQMRAIAATDAVTASVTVSDAEIQAYYEEKLAADREHLAEFPGDYRWLSEYELCLWVPEGYRMARVVLIPFSEEQQAVYDELIYQLFETSSEEEWHQVSAQMNELHAALLPEAQAARARLDEGAAFDDLRAAYAEPTLSLGSLAAEEGFPASESSWEFPTDEFMRLPAPGDVTGPIACDSGYMLVEYLAPLPSGPVPFADVADALAEFVLSEKRSSMYEETIEKWMLDANIEYLTDHLFN